MKTIKTYSELCLLTTYEDRYIYLKLPGVVGMDTFGHDRYLNQILYTSREWKTVREQVIVRDRCQDLGISENEIMERVIVHHMNPITVDDILKRNPIVFDPEFLITMADSTHRAIHYGSPTSPSRFTLPERSSNDTAPWRKR